MPIWLPPWASYAPITAHTTRRTLAAILAAATTVIATATGAATTIIATATGAAIAPHAPG